ncbi:MAG: hypothetical protein LBF51_06920 [Zoogloeaceae bacterium]|jgi:uncharacterized membrane-anchored protein YhcB (DUF1043 family)|nr:hypothetical protein [Zoogloeaceae bacterium]
MKKSVLGISFLFSCVVSAQAPELPAGEYGGGGSHPWDGWSKLAIAPAKDGKQAFELESVGVNGHVCSLSGEIEAGNAVLSEEGEAPCVLLFSATKDGMEVVPVDSDPDAPPAYQSCRRYCGTRAWFGGVYSKVPQGCDQASIKQTQTAFEEYRKKQQFTQAEEVLKPLFQACADRMDYHMARTTVNNIARMQTVQKRWKDCLATLEPYTKEADEEIAEELYPVEREIYLEAAKETHAIQRRCRFGEKAQQ